MSENKLAFHYVCTIDEAKKLVDGRYQFWVANCGCREKRKHCDRSRLDLCPDQNNCWGCGVCVASCPDECISMVKRI